MLLRAGEQATHIVRTHSRTRIHTRTPGTWWVSLNICRNIKKSIAVTINVSVDTVLKTRARHAIGGNRSGEAADPDPSGYHAARRVWGSGCEVQVADNGFVQWLMSRLPSFEANIRA